MLALADCGNIERGMIDIFERVSRSKRNSVGADFQHCVNYRLCPEITGRRQPDLV
jgi:hypothetical protein